MSIKRRMILILTGLAVLYMIATYGVFRFAVFPTFEDLERDLQDRLHRCRTRGALLLLLASESLTLPQG